MFVARFIGVLLGIFVPRLFGRSDQGSILSTFGVLLRAWFGLFWALLFGVHSGVCLGSICGKGKGIQGFFFETVN